MNVIMFPAVVPSEVDPPVDEVSQGEQEARQRAQDMIDLEHLNFELQHTVAALSVKLQQERAGRLKAIQAYPYLWTGAGVFLAAGAAGVLRMHGIETAALIFVFPIIAASVAFGRWPAVFGVLLQAALYNLIWVEPVARFTLPNDSEIVRFVLYMSIPFMIHALRRLDWPPADVNGEG